jgi:cytochrome b pre-mRNA-processing protein 3
MKTRKTRVEPAMIFPLFRSKSRRQRDQQDLALYTALVAQARQPAFYRDLGVPDTVQGRYEMVVLHVYLLWRKLRNAPAPHNALGQRLFDLMVKDTDSALREMGVGDLSVAKKIKPMVEIFYGRTKAYDEALAEKDADSLVAMLGRNIYREGQDQAAHSLAHYIKDSAAALDALTVEDAAAGKLAFAPLEHAQETITP